MPTKKEKPLYSIHFKYPPLNAALRKLTPKERVAFIDARFQNNLKQITRLLKGKPFEIIGTKKRPHGIRIRGTNEQLAVLARLPYVSFNFVDTPKGKKEPAAKEKLFFCFNVVIQIQIEGVQKGNQMIDECFLMVTARNLEQAERKLKRHFKREEDVYLNYKGQMVRWSLERIEESYLTFITPEENFEKPVEVFSKLKQRRLKRENIWNGN